MTLNVVIPMAGRGSRFSKVGYTVPKPLIEVDGKPLIQIVIDNLKLEAKYIFLVLKEHNEKYKLNELLPSLTAPNPCEIVEVDQVTEGAACTVLLAKNLINTDDELLIANSDQWVWWSAQDFIDYMRASEADGGIVTFIAYENKWSYAKIVNYKITHVAEKNPISEHATVGIYYFARGKEFVEAAEQMIDKNIRVNNEFYVCPVYNEIINSGKIIKPYPIPMMCGLGTPEDLNEFLNSKQKIYYALKK